MKWDARREAIRRRNDQRGLNDSEYAYSPGTGAVGMRWDEDSIFRVFNVNYPMYKRNEQVRDWVSVGTAEDPR